MLAYAFELPQATPSLNEIRHMHWGAYASLRQDFHVLVRQALAAQKRWKLAPPLSRAGIAVLRGSAGQGLDWDNALGGLKPLMDVLVAPSTRNPSGLGLIEDDAPRVIPVAPLMRQCTAPRGKGFTCVWVFDLSAMTEEAYLGEALAAITAKAHSH